jgi:hypothetical protein
MSKYTVELGQLSKSNFKIFNFDYEFYDTTKKEDFEQKFINHFYFREIGVETPARFVHYLKCKCDEILPYYNMLWRTALIDYEKTVNYKLTETYVRDVDKNDNVTSNENNQGTNVTTGTTSDEKTSTLNSTTDHSQNNDITHNEKTEENGTLDKRFTESQTNVKTNHNTVDTKKIESDTPKGLLSMKNIETTVYASKANIDSVMNNTTDNEDNKLNNVDTQSTFADKSLDLTETSNGIASDVVEATNKDNASSTQNNNVSFNNTSTNSQNVTGNEKENSTRTTLGSFGVITEADMLQKHINLQKTLTKILSNFFDECEDLFMQLY